MSCSGASGADADAEPSAHPSLRQQTVHSSQRGMYLNHTATGGKRGLNSFALPLSILTAVRQPSAALLSGPREQPLRDHAACAERCHSQRNYAGETTLSMLTHFCFLCTRIRFHLLALDCARLLQTVVLHQNPMARGLPNHLDFEVGRMPPRLSSAAILTP